MDLTTRLSGPRAHTGLCLSSLASTISTVCARATGFRRAVADLTTGVAPYNGTIAVTANSRTLTQSEHSADLAYTTAQRQCELVAQYLEATAPIRVDCRRRGHGGGFVLFDVNMKPARVAELALARADSRTQRDLVGLEGMSRPRWSLWQPRAWAGITAR